MEAQRIHIVTITGFVSWCLGGSSNKVDKTPSHEVTKNTMAMAGMRWQAVYGRDLQSSVTGIPPRCQTCDRTPGIARMAMEIMATDL